MARKSKRKNVLDWWQTVLDETKDLIDDGIDRLRDDDDDDDLASEVADLKRSIVDLSAKLAGVAVHSVEMVADRLQRPLALQQGRGDIEDTLLRRMAASPNPSVATGDGVLCWVPSPSWP